MIRRTHAIGSSSPPKAAAAIMVLALAGLTACGPGSDAHSASPTTATGGSTGAGGSSSGGPGTGGGIGIGGLGPGGNAGSVSMNGGATSGGTGATEGGANPGTGGAPPPSVLGKACDAPALGHPLLRLLNRSAFDQTIADIFPQIEGQWTNTLPSDQVSALGFDNDASVLVGSQYAHALLDTAESIGAAVGGTALSTILPCAASADRACAATFVTDFGRRLFRRALTQAEQDRYLAYYDSARAITDFPTAIKWLTAGLVQSPHAVYRREIGVVGTDGARQLSSQELATELAYTFTGSTPSSNLLTQADSGQLDPAALAATMLASERGQDVIQHFFTSWLAYTRVTAIEKPNVPDYATLRADMASEVRAFVDNIVIANDGSLLELLSSPTTFPSAPLAAYYGIPAPSAAGAAVTRPAGRGMGVLSLGAMLATHSQPDGSSPTQRGLFVFQRLMCQDKPQLPDIVPPLPPLQPGVSTTRQRYEELHAVGGCATCHMRFDPIGFGFEHFDEGGRYRETESGLAIDSSGSVLGPDLNPLFTFSGLDDLVQGLLDQPGVHQCFASYLATYAFGTAESCLGTSRVAELSAGTLGIVDYFATLAAEPNFTTRQAQ